MTYYRDERQYRPAAIGPAEVETLYNEVSQLLDRAVNLPSVRQPLGEVALTADIGHRQRDLAFLMLNAGRLEFADHAFKGAIQTFERLTEQLPKEAGYWHALADSHRQVGRIAIERATPVEVEKQFRRAIQLYEQQARNVPNQSVSDAEWAAAYLDLAQLLISIGRQQEAAPLITRAVEINPSKEKYSGKLEAELLLGEMLRDAGKVDEAFALYSKIIAAEPDVADAWAGRGNCHLAMADFVKAESDFAAAIKLNPDRADFWTGRAWAHFQLKQWDSAVSDYSEAIKRAPDVHTNWYTRGRAYLHLAQWDKAADDFTKAVNQWPHDPEGWYYRGGAYAQLSRPNEAVADLRQAIAKGFKDVELMKNDLTLDPLRANDKFKKLLTDFAKEKR